MRLTCPNCDAQYEVPDEVIPTTGRDVQCSNCGQTWYQHHADHAPSDEDDEAEDISAPAPDEEVSPPPEPTPPAAEPERKRLDPAVADILRQEAEAEREARTNTRDTATLETQPELGIDDSAPEDDAERRARESRTRMARMRGEDPEQLDDAATTAAALNSRRDLLPDIEEINSSLRSSSDQDEGGASDQTRIDAPTHQRKKRGFRSGFMLIVLLALILSAIYLFAPQLSAAVPALEPTLTQYVALIDQGRVWLNGQVTTFLQWLDAMASSSKPS
ncbi:hypothetical protein C1J03_18280 [Sulfitobacter sp. SK012]|uniref:zinc-ribbon domain-containing protein n=1 Tax=Sulfitobacter sp. SK012 TaxID=1389005 RepID=UPI000E0C8173|nr:zinc-ribbon domain-containing protein [Sulfitobacter sp. SK012]AXI47783.1 hypothetical protein C1J03_18280 [Sulfitobacter sp. SK012]